MEMVLVIGFCRWNIRCTSPDNFPEEKQFLALDHNIYDTMLRRFRTIEAEATRGDTGFMTLDLQRS